MKSLYSRLARQWDVLFPPDNDRIVFISDLLDGEASDNRIIEVGCGTGTTALSLAAAGYSVAASDLDPEMIAIAEQSFGKGAEAAMVRFSVDDMIGALEAASAGSANLILCLGNTLPHLTESGEMTCFFQAARRALASDGKLVVQVLNYRRIIGLGSLNLPDLQGDGIVFRRRQVYLPDIGSISFQTEVESEGVIERRTHNLHPVTVEEMVGYSTETGLTESGIFCDWNRTPFSEEQPWLAVVFKSQGASD